MQMGILVWGMWHIARRLMRSDTSGVYNRTPDKVKQLESEGERDNFLDEFVNLLTPPRAAWVMVPAGVVTEQMVMELAQKMEPGDIIIDGGNSYYKDDVRRAKFCKSWASITSMSEPAVVWLRAGYCLMIGGEKQALNI